MIVFELLWKSAAWILFKLIRFILWLFAARDCKHCKYHYMNRWNRPGCTKGFGDFETCRAHPCYSHFERKNKPKSFFDIL